VLCKERLGEQRREEVAGDERTGVVDEEAAIGVAVPRDAEIRAARAHPLDDQLPVLGQKRIGLMVGKVPVGRPTGLDQIKAAEAVEQRTDHRSRHPVPAVHHHLQRTITEGSPDGVHVDELKGGRLELSVDVDLLHRAARPLVRLV
jgi:hypothetical protein